MNNEEPLDYFPEEMKEEKGRPEWHFIIQFIQVMIMGFIPTVLTISLLSMMFKNVYYFLVTTAILIGLCSYQLSIRNEQMTKTKRIFCTIGISVGLLLCLIAALGSIVGFVEMLFIEDFDPTMMLGPSFFFFLTLLFLIPVVFGIIELRFLWKEMPIKEINAPN